MKRMDMDRRWNMLSDSIARALIRVPLMKYTQLAEYLGIHPFTVFRVVSRFPGRFKQMKYDSSEHQGSLYNIRTKGTQNFVQLTSSARMEWEEISGLRSYRIVPANVSRIIASADLVVALQKAGLFPHLWDVTLPQERADSVHLWLTEKMRTATLVTDLTKIPHGSGTVEEKPIGVYLVPHHKDKWAKKNFLIGVAHRVIQHIEVNKVLFLVDKKHYMTALRNLTGTGRFNASNIYLLPLESFCQNPTRFLDAIVTGDRMGIENAFLFNPPRKVLTVPVGYPYSTLIQDKQGEYRFFDYYASGQIEKVRLWQSHSRYDPYLIPGEGKMAFGAVHVPDETMYQALQARLKGTGAHVYRESDWFEQDSDVEGRMDV